MFARKSDDWGRMFSYNEWIPKLFPNFSEFNLLRDTAMKYYDCIKVRNKISEVILCLKENIQHSEVTEVHATI